jgi:HEAT repeat protein
MKELRSFLDPEEPDYHQAARLGVAALPLIESLISGNDAMLASKATYLAGLIADPKSIAVLQTAAVSSNVQVRLAAAAGARHLDADNASALLITLLNDADFGVRKVSLGSAPSRATLPLRKRIEEISTGSAEPLLRDLSMEALRRMGPRR